MKLTDKQCKNAKATDKDLKLSDGGGLFLLTKTDGKKYWHMSYRFLGKQKLLSLGPYPKIPLAKARTEREKNKQLLSEGKDPSEVRKQQKLDLQKKTENNFYSVAMRWHEIKKSKVNKKTAQTILNRLTLDVFPHIGTMDVTKISTNCLLKVLQKVQDRSAIEVAHRLLWICTQVFDYARIEDLTQTNPTWGLSKGLKNNKVKHRPCIKFDKIPDFLKDFKAHAQSLNPIKIFTFKLLMLTFVRTSELIGATWDEFDLDKKVWTIPADRMKMKREHRVPSQC